MQHEVKFIDKVDGLIVARTWRGGVQHDAGPKATLSPTTEPWARSNKILSALKHRWFTYYNMVHQWRLWARESFSIDNVREINLWVAFQYSLLLLKASLSLLKVETVFVRGELCFYGIKAGQSEHRYASRNTRRGDEDIHFLNIHSS